MRFNVLTEFKPDRRLYEVFVGFFRDFPRLKIFRKQRNSVCYLKQKGIVLLSTVLVMLTVAIVGASLMLFFYTVNVSARTMVEQVKAFYLAEAGIAQAVFTLRNSAGEAEEAEQKIGPFILGDGSYTVVIDYVQSLILSHGTVGGITKTLQLQFNSM